MGIFRFKFGKKRNWDILRLDWLSGGVQADPATDLRVSLGKMSVWWIEDDESNLDLVILALASSRDYIEKLEYGLFPEQIPSQLEIKVDSEAGDTPVSSANNYHRHLIEMTTDSLARFVNIIFHDMQKSRKLKPQVREMIISEWGKKINIDVVKSNLRTQIESDL